ncbi:MAG: hypothetical protein WD200_01025 [Candidatus Andersenbacteria bacterium]
MIPQIPKIFVILVHYGSATPTQQALSALMRSRRLPDAVVIVDHADVPLRLSAISDSVTIIRPAANTGYSGGILVGVSFLAARGAQPDDVVVCMNNDAEVGIDVLEKIYAMFKDATTPLLVGARSGSVNMFSGRAHIEDRTRAAWYRKPYIHGSLFATTFDVFTRARLPVSYFLYWEDVAWSWRLSAQGVQLVSLPQVVVKHNDMRKDLTSSQLYYLARNGARALTWESGAWGGYWQVLNWGRFIYHRFVSRKDVVWRALRDSRKNHMGRISL